MCAFCITFLNFLNCIQLSYPQCAHVNILFLALLLLLLLLCHNFFMKVCNNGEIQYQITKKCWRFWYFFCHMTTVQVLLLKLFCLVIAIMSLLDIMECFKHWINPDIITFLTMYNTQKWLWRKITVETPKTAKNGQNILRKFF